MPVGERTKALIPEARGEGLQNPPQKTVAGVAATKLTTSGGGVAKRRAKKRAPSAALASLSSLGVSLDEAAAGGGGGQRQFGRSLGTARARARVAEVEAPRLQQVLAHPQFQANPLAAVASHLAATLPPPPPPPAARQAPKDAAAARREKKKRRRERARAEAAMGDD